MKIAAKGIIYKALIFALLASFLVSLVGCTPDYKENNGNIAVTIGEFDVSYDFYAYFYLMYQKQGIEEYGVEYTDKQLVEKTENSLKEIAAALAMADEYGVSVSKKQEEEIHDYIASIKDGYNDDEAFYKELSNNFMSEQVMFDIQYYSVLEANLRAELTSEQAGVIDFSDKALEAALESEFMAAVNILIFPETERDGLKGKALADSIYQKIVDGGDIYALAEEYSDDGFYGDRYFAPNTTHEYFESKVAALEIGEMSEVYESELGFNITKRVALDRDYIEEYYEELRDELAYSRYLDIMDGTAEKQTVTYSEGFDTSAVKDLNVEP